MQLFNSIYIRSSLVCFSLLLQTFSLVRIQKQKLALISQLTRLHLCNGFFLENTNKFWNSFQTSQECTQGLLILDCRLLVTITFCLIKFRLLFYNMHTHISWCYSSSFVNISCQLVRFFFFTNLLLLSKLACCYSLVVICYYKKIVKIRVITNSFPFSEFIVTPSNTGLLCF